MQHNPRQSKFLLGVAALALTLTAGGAVAGMPDRTATALWGPSSLVWLTEKPVTMQSAADPAPDAAPRSMVWKEKMGGSEGGMMATCNKKADGAKMHAAHMQAMAHNAPLHAQLEKLHGDVKALWTAKTFDRAAFLAKRAEMRVLQTKMEQNMDAAVAQAAMTMTPEQRSEVGTCWFHRHHPWFEKKLQKKHHGARKRHGAKAHGKKHADAQLLPGVKTEAKQPETEQGKTAEPPKAEEEKK